MVNPRALPHNSEELDYVFYEEEEEEEENLILYENTLNMRHKLSSKLNHLTSTSYISNFDFGVEKEWCVHKSVIHSLTFVILRIERHVRHSETKISEALELNALVALSESFVAVFTIGRHWYIEREREITRNIAVRNAVLHVFSCDINDLLCNISLYSDVITERIFLGDIAIQFLL